MFQAQVVTPYVQLALLVAELLVLTTLCLKPFPISNEPQASLSFVYPFYVLKFLWLDQHRELHLHVCETKFYQSWITDSCPSGSQKPSLD